MPIVSEAAERYLPFRAATAMLAAIPNIIIAAMTRVAVSYSIAAES